MRKYLIVLFAFLAGRSFAQKIRFTDAGNQWITHYHVGSDPTPYSGGHFFRIGNDTIILGRTYKPLVDSDVSCMGSGSNDAFFLSEDTIDNKVYYWSTVDSTNHVLYDFNLGLGDSLVYTPGYNVDSVIAIDSINIDGLFYKVFTMQLKGTTFFPQLFTLIEGIGCTNGPLWPLDVAGAVEYSEALMCYTHNLLLPSITAPRYLAGLTDSFRNGYYGCDPLYSAYIFRPITTIAAYPNPAKSTLTITSHHPISQITITNLLGQVIVSRKCKQEEVQIDVSEFSKGMYFVNVDGLAVRKFAKE